MRAWQWYNSNIYTQRVYGPFDVRHRCHCRSTRISLVSVHSINLFHTECLVSPQGHSSYVHTERSFAVSHPSARGADVGSSSWAPHPWLDLAQPAGSEATWHPGWPGKQASPVGRRLPGLSLRLQLCAATGDFSPSHQKKTKPLCVLLSHSAVLCCHLYFENSMRSFFLGGGSSAAFAEVNFHKSLRLIQLLQLRDGGITL